MLNEYRQEFIDFLFNEGKCQKTVLHHLSFLDNCIFPVIGDKDIKDVKLIDRVCVMDKGRNFGEYGALRAVCTLRVFLRFLKEKGLKLPFDYRDFKLPHVPKLPAEYLTEDEVEAVKSCLNVDDMQDLRTMAIIELVLCTGLRSEEICSLDKKDINFEKREVKVKNCKTKEWGTVYLTRSAIFWIQKYIERRKDDLPCLFVSGRSRLLKGTARAYLIKKTRCLPINKHICNTIFRKTFVTTLLRKKCDIRTVQDLARHKSPKTTLTYYSAVNKEHSKKMHRLLLDTV